MAEPIAAPPCIVCESSDTTVIDVTTTVVKYYRCRACGHVWIVNKDGSTRDFTRRTKKR